MRKLIKRIIGKKEIIALMALTLMFAITGCKNIGTIDGKTGTPVAETDTNVKADIIMKAEKETYSNKVEEITITIENNSSNEYYYGEEFSLEQEVDGEWVLVSPKEEIFVIGIANILESNGKNTFVSSLRYYNELFDGQYRIVKNMIKANSEDEATDQAEKFLLAAEFNISSEADTTAKDDTTDWKPTNFTTVNNFDDVTMSVKKDTLSDNGLTVMFQNKADKICMYGEKFVLEKKLNEQWYEVPVTINGNYAFNDIGYEVASGQDKEWEVDWNWLYGSLNAGEYRIVKDVLDFRNTGDFDTYYLTAEFTLSN